MKKWSPLQTQTQYRCEPNDNPIEHLRTLSRSHCQGAGWLSRPLALDLFCCAGGVAEGLHRAGYQVVGIDIKPQPRYPFAFIQGDAMSLSFSRFALIWASPPCQRWSDLAKRNGNAENFPDLIEPTRAKLVESGCLYSIENVEGAPLRPTVTLCGTMFPGLRVLRHRQFETNFPVLQPAHGRHPKVHTFDKRKSHFGKTDESVDFVQVTGGGNCTLAAASNAMGIDWMTKAEINEAIPPAYSEYIGRAALATSLDCNRRMDKAGEWVCDRCGSLWFGELAKTDWRPSNCPVSLATTTSLIPRRPQHRKVAT